MRVRFRDYPLLWGSREYTNIPEMRENLDVTGHNTILHCNKIDTIMMGFIYFLQDPITKLPFYVGATKSSLSMRLTGHYQHLREYERGDRGWNKRYQYLIDLRPLRCLIQLVEIVEDTKYLDDAEKMYIAIFKEWGFDLVNQTDGGKGGDTAKDRTQEQTERFRTRIRSKLKGKPKPVGFAEALSKARMRANNPQAGTTKYSPIVCFDKAGNAVRMFKHPYEVRDFIGLSNSTHANVIRVLTGKIRHHRPGGYDWKFLHDCDQPIQDIVQSLYESESSQVRDGIRYVN